MERKTAKKTKTKAKAPTRKRVTRKKAQPKIESLNYVLDNLDQTIKKRVFASEGGSDSPYDLSTYSLTKTIIKERFNVKKQN